MRRAIFCAASVLWLAACDGDPSLPYNGNPKATVAAPSSGAAGAASASTQPTATTPNTLGIPQAAPASQNAPATQAQPATQGAAPAPTATPTMQNAPAQDPSMVQGIPPPDGFVPNVRDQCGLHTQWPGDEYCILPPPADKGFQLHIGPSNYDNPEATYLLQPGQENVHTYTATSANDHDIFFYVRQYRMRPGAHHTIVRDTSTGRRLSGSDVNQDHPVGGITAPENAGIGIPLTAHAPISVDHHAINTTQKALLQEVWVNFWYVDPSKVTQSTNLLYDPGDISMTVAPKADVVLGPYSCDINAPGRLISMFGHVHANDVRFSAWRTRGNQRDLIYEAYHWEEPLWLEFTSLAKNKVADPTMGVDGGWSGILDLQPGDTLTWECHEVNQQDTTLRFVNQTYDGVMCIIIGDLVGTKCQSRNPSAALFNPSLE